MAESPTISIIIPSYNESTYIGRLLDALTAQNFKDFEVIVSDAESKDGTPGVVNPYKDKLDLRIVLSPPNGPGAGRNEGAKVARGEWLLFLDADDDINDPNFIGTLLSETKKRGWGSSTARMTTRNGPSYAPLFYYQRLLAHTKRPVASGYCIFTKRTIFEKAGGFNEKIHFGEDYEYISRTGKYGFGFVTSTYYYVDPRRNQEEKLSLTWKGTINEVYRLIFGYKKLEKNSIKYEFGKHTPRERY